MLELKFCRICLDDNVRMHQISGSEVQDVYEKLINKKVQEEGRLHYACYICYRHLKNCQKLIIKSQKSEELLRQILQIDSEMHPKSINHLDRQTYGLKNSLMVAKLESIQIPDYNNILKIENQCGSDSNEVMVKDEPDDDSEFQNNEIKMEKHDFEQDKVGAIENRKENIFKTKTNLVSNENKSSQIGCDEIYNNQLLKDDKKCFINNDRHTKALFIKHIIGYKPVNVKPKLTFIKTKKSVSHRRDTENGDLNKVNDIYTDEKIFKCQYCDYIFANESILQTHVRTHTAKKTFQCEYCSYICISSGNLKVHVSTHTGEKPHKCRFCNHAFAHIFQLKGHIKHHKKSKPYKCQYAECDLKFVSNESLKKHSRTHTVVKPYKCQYCSFTFFNNTSLKDHIIQTHLIPSLP